MDALCALYIIQRMKFLINQTGEMLFFLKQDPNYTLPQISMFNAPNVLIRNKRKGGGKQKPTA